MNHKYYQSLLRQRFLLRVLEYGILNIKSGTKKTAHFQKLAISKKSTILIQSVWNLAKIFTSWVNYVHQVSYRLDQNCGFFTNS